MGSGSSRNNVKKIDKGNQMPSVSEIKPVPKPSVSPSPSKSYEPLFLRVRPKSSRQRVSIQENDFEIDSNIEEYSTVWDHDTKLSSTFQKSLKSGLHKIEHHQKETLNNKWENKSSTNFDSAHIQSIIDTQTHSCINLSSSEKIDELINNLNHIHTQLDEIIKHRTGQISTETEFILSYILNETQQNQQRLLTYAKEQQMKKDENYRKLLEEYISHLDEMKAKELNDLQKQLQIYRDQILEESQLKIMTVNEQANLTKAKILKEEQHQAAEKIDSIISQIQKISTDEKLQHLGSETITKINLITNTNVGTKVSGQDCTFIFDENNSIQNIRSQQRPQSNKKKTSNSERHTTLIEEQIANQSLKTVSITQKSKRQE